MLLALKAATETSDVIYRLQNLIASVMWASPFS